MTVGKIIQFSHHHSTGPPQEAKSSVKTARVIPLSRSVDTVEGSQPELVATEVKSVTQGSKSIDIKKFKQWIREGSYKVDCTELAEILVNHI